MRIAVTGTLGAVALFCAGMAQAEESQVFSNNGFSIAFPESWHAKKITDGMISAVTTNAAPAQASAEIYYGVLPPNATQHDKTKFHAIQKNHSVRDYISKKDIAAAKWHSKIATEKLDKGVSVEKLDVETLQRVARDSKRKQPVCNYYRQYHTPLTELHLTYSQRGTCAATKVDFDSFSKLLIWNGQ